MKMFLKSEWAERDSRIDVVNPYNGEAFDTVPEATTADVTAAVDGLVEGAKVMRAMAALERCEILRKAATLMRARVNEIGTLISTEEGKILAEGKLEVSRAAETIDLSADEARRLTTFRVRTDRDQPAQDRRDARGGDHPGVRCGRRPPYSGPR